MSLSVLPGMVWDSIQGSQRSWGSGSFGQNQPRRSRQGEIRHNSLRSAFGTYSVFPIAFHSAPEKASLRGFAGSKPLTFNGLRRINTDFHLKPLEEIPHQSMKGQFIPPCSRTGSLFNHLPNAA